MAISRAELGVSKLPANVGFSGSEMSIKCTPAAFELTVDTGYLGDLIVLDVAITDGVDTWTQTVSMEVSERPWTAVPGAVDGLGDANGYMFDIASIEYKTDGEVLWLKTDSYTPFDASTLWMTYVFYDVPRWWRLEFIYSEFKLYDDWFDGWFLGTEVEPSLPMLWREEQEDVALQALEDLEFEVQQLVLALTGFLEAGGNSDQEG